MSRSLITCLQFIRKLHFGFMNVILLHIDHRHLSATFIKPKCIVGHFDQFYANI